MTRDYYDLDFMDRTIDTSPIAPALAEFFDDVLDQSVAKLNFKVSVPTGPVLQNDSDTCSVALASSIYIYIYKA